MSRLHCASIALLVASALLCAQALADDVDIKNKPHAQTTNFYCGPATIEMILDSPSVRALNANLANTFANNANNQNDHAIQTQVYQVAHGSNFEPWFTDPQGMKSALNFYDGAFHQYNWISTVARQSAFRTLVNAMKNYDVSGGMLVSGGAHWVNINGATTDAPIVRNQPYKVTEIRGHDPAWVVAPKLSLGKNFALGINDRAFYRYFNAVKPTSSYVWANRYVTVVEPLGPELPGRCRGQ
jgi:hypothetical protein